ncbi:MAG: AraC family transcriptional regulator [Bacteroidetes bacterium HGW-Bacteroidetes-11]|nr:MAG: AraC family transcriptional regulator [Bacteroidetes bacterium HGW-Bacteroidetes-11]
MKLYIKNMVSDRCKMIVKSELLKLGLHHVMIDIGEVEIMETLSAEQQENLNSNLRKTGLLLISDKKSILLEKIKNIIIDLVYYAEKPPKTNFSDYLSEKLDYDYTYMANLFSETQNTTIEQYIINLKIERVKELLIYDELNISEIADKMHYSSLSHLSSQFKKITGLTPSYYKRLRNNRRKPIENV